MININKNCFSSQSEPHTAKLGVADVLKHFWRNSLRTLLFKHKSYYLRKEHKNINRFFFPTMFERGKPVEIMGLFKELFLIKQVKGDKYEQKLFFTTK